MHRVEAETDAVGQQAGAAVAVQPDHEVPDLGRLLGNLPRPSGVTLGVGDPGPAVLDPAALRGEIVEPRRMSRQEAGVPTRVNTRNTRAWTSATRARSGLSGQGVAHRGAAMGRQVGAQTGRQGRGRIALRLLGLGFVVRLRLGVEDFVVLAGIARRARLAIVGGRRDRFTSSGRTKPRSTRASPS